MTPASVFLACLVAAVSSGVMGGLLMAYQLRRVYVVQARPGGVPLRAFATEALALAFAEEADRVHAGRPDGPCPIRATVSPVLLEL